jgi:hypothetical protein
MLIPVIIRTTGSISESFNKCLSNRNGKHAIMEVQKNGYTWHSSHTWESTNVNAQNVYNWR